MTTYCPFNVNELKFDIWQVDIWDETTGEVYTLGRNGSKMADWRPFFFIYIRQFFSEMGEDMDSKLDVHVQVQWALIEFG